jgi:hypothetical protein
MRCILSPVLTKVSAAEPRSVLGDSCVEIADINFNVSLSKSPRSKNSPSVCIFLNFVIDPTITTLRGNEWHGSLERSKNVMGILFWIIISNTPRQLFGKMDRPETKVFATAVVLVIGFVSLGVYLLNSKNSKKTKSSKKKADIKSQAKAKPTHSDDSGDEVQALRGYKKTASGKTTTYFHRELSESEQKLLGDNAPKKIEKDPSTQSIQEVGSAWNAAGTWEEKNIGEWSQKQLKQLLLAISLSHLDGFVRLLILLSIQVN